MSLAPYDFAASHRAAFCAARVAVGAAVSSSERGIRGVSDPLCHPPVEVPRLKRGGRSRPRCMSLSSGRTRFVRNIAECAAGVVRDTYVDFIGRNTA
jgi:hypothetical protein